MGLWSSQKYQSLFPLSIIIAFVGNFEQQNTTQFIMRFRKGTPLEVSQCCWGSVNSPDMETIKYYVFCKVC